MSKAKKNTGPDWNAIKSDFIKGTSVRKLAEEYGISESTIESRSRREKWGELRRKMRGKCAEKLPEKIADAIASSAAEVAGEHFRIWGLLLAKAEKMLEGTHKVQDPLGNVFDLPTVSTAKELRELAGGLKDITQGQRLAAGMPNEAKEAKADLLTAQDDDGMSVVPEDSPDWEKFARGPRDGMDA